MPTAAVLIVKACRRLGSLHLQWGPIDDFWGCRGVGSLATKIVPDGANPHYGIGADLKGQPAEAAE